MRTRCATFKAGVRHDPLCKQLFQLHKLEIILPDERKNRPLSITDVTKSTHGAKACRIIRIVESKRSRNREQGVPVARVIDTTNCVKLFEKFLFLVLRRYYNMFECNWATNEYGDACEATSADRNNPPCPVNCMC